MNPRKLRERQHAALRAKRGDLGGPQTIESAIRSLRPGDPAHWTRDGRPNAVVLSELLGRPVSAAERDAAWAGTA